MKNAIIYLSLFLIFPFTSCHNNEKLKSNKSEISKDDYIFNFIKIYGVLKYYHPKYSTGKKSIDSLFINTIPVIDTISSKTSYNLLIKDIIKINNELNDTIITNYLFLKDSILDKLNYKTILNLINTPIEREELYYVGNYKGNIGEAIFKNEKLKNDTIYPDLNIRLLSIAKYWNTLKYFYPYKNQIPNFNSFIKEYINKIRNVKNAQEYHLLIMEMTSYLQDAHITTKSLIISDFFGRKYLPFTITKIKNKFYANLIIDSTSTINIQTKNELLAINGININKIEDTISKYISSKNKEHFNYLLCNLISKTKRDSIEIKYISTLNDTIKETITTISNAKYVLSTKNYNKSFFKNDTTYLNLINVTKKEIDYAFNNKKVVILDLRNHIKNGLMYYIADKLFPNKIKYFYLSMPNLNNPGTYKFTDIYTVGGKHKNVFNGKLIVFSNGNTISQAETALLIFKLYKNTTVIGRKSCGANGNVTYLDLPGKIRTRFSGIGVYYLNKNHIQFKGIQPDIEIYKTFDDYFNEADEMFKYYKLDRI